MSISGANMYHYAAFGYKSVPFEKVQPQWQLLYLFFWECITEYGLLSCLMWNVVAVAVASHEASSCDEGS